MLSRRHFLEICAFSIGTTSVSPTRVCAAAHSVEWRSGLGLNGFMSSSQRYEKNYLIWEVLDFAARTGK